MKKPGANRHFGEFWGQGIQRNYGLKEKRWSLFNVGRWVLHNETPTEKQKQLPKCCSLVPILYEGLFTTLAAEGALSTLQLHGSKAAPGFMKPEGIVIYHAAANMLFKKTIEQDSVPKGSKGVE